MAFSAVLIGFLFFWAKVGEDDINNWSTMTIVTNIVLLQPLHRRSHPDIVNSLVDGIWNIHKHFNKKPIYIALITYGTTVKLCKIKLWLYKSRSMEKWLINWQYRCSRVMCFTLYKVSLLDESHKIQA